MRIVVAVSCGLWAAASFAHADPPQSVADYITDMGSTLGNGRLPDNETKPTRFGFTDDVPVVDKLSDGPLGGGVNTSTKHAVTAWSADKKVAWVATDVFQFGNCCCGPCDLVHPIGTMHATFVAEVGAAWHLVAFSATGTVTAAAQAKAAAGGHVPAVLARRIDAGAEDVGKLFESTIGDPKAFAATVSDRTDVVLYGSDLAERTTGGAQVAAQLVKWNLKLAARDGVQAGVAGSTVAWVAANVDATSLKKPKDKPMPYRVFAIYEKTTTGWKLVSATFSVA